MLIENPTLGVGFRKGFTDEQVVKINKDVILNLIQELPFFVVAVVVFNSQSGRFRIKYAMTLFYYSFKQQGQSVGSRVWQAVKKGF